MSDLAIEYLPIGSLTPYARNARTHSPDQVDQVAASITEFGWTNPVLIDETGGIIAGHGCVMAAQKLGIDPVPCIRLAHLTDVQRRAYILADNKLALNAEWDEALLESELENLTDDGFDITIAGFDAMIDDIQTGDGEVKRVQTSHVSDRFWISIRGPLPKQAIALRRLMDVMAEIGAVDVELGTVAQDE
jgi:hypothetical protein